MGSKEQKIEEILCSSATDQYGYLVFVHSGGMDCLRKFIKGHEDIAWGKRFWGNGLCPYVFPANETKSRSYP
jgi:hypothetical protein